MVLGSWKNLILPAAVTVAAIVFLRILYQSDQHLLRTVVLTERVRLADISNNAARVAFVGEIDTKTGKSEVSVCNTRNGNLLHNPIAYPAYNIRFSPDSNHFAVGGQDGVRLLHSETGKVLRLLEGEQIFAIAFSRMGTLATGSADGTVRIWSITDGQLVASLDVGERVINLDFAQNEMLAIGTSAQTGVVLRSQLPQKQYEIVLWKIGELKEMARFSAHGISVTSLRFSPDGGFFASGGPDGLVKLWNMESTKPLWTYKISTSFTGLIRGHSRGVNDLAFSDDGRILAIASDQEEIVLLRVSDGKLLEKLQGHNGAALKVLFINSEELLTVGEDGTIKWWRLRGANN